MNLLVVVTDGVFWGHNFLPHIVSSNKFNIKLKTTVVQMSKYLIHSGYVLKYHLALRLRVKPAIHLPICL